MNKKDYDKEKYEKIEDNILKELESFQSFLYHHLKMHLAITFVMTLNRYLQISLLKTIDFICEEIYTHKKLKPICKQSIFHKLLYKLITECTFSATGKLQKQVDNISMGGTKQKKNFWILK